MADSDKSYEDFLKEPRPLPVRKRTNSVIGHRDEVLDPTLLGITQHSRLDLQGIDIEKVIRVHDSEGSVNIDRTLVASPK